MKEFNANFTQIIKILNDKEYHDGSTIGNKLGITRSAVWKALKKLESYGVEIDSVKGRGYMLQEPLVLLDRKYIEKHIHKSKPRIEIFESICSTNEYLKELSADKFPRICIAEQQTKGRGRLGRDWYSPFAQNISLSCRYSFQKDISGLAGLSLVVALAVIDALKKHCSSAQIMAKWPNDIVFESKKLAGILIDIQAEANGLCSAIIGIGINVNMMSDKNLQISQAWTSMGKMLGCHIDRNEVCVSLIDSLLEYLERFADTGLTGFTREWNKVDYLSGQKITIKTADKKIIGMSDGINQLGQLMIDLPGGSTKAFSSGDVSVYRKKIKA
jgi:BirA family transcriptional regulator, biotin operon repressor / biotin---[acetyl-CoA-carboxylase] ligase